MANGNQNNIAKASIVLTFAASCAVEDHFINVEMDDEKNQGKTCFLYGEKIYFRVFTNPKNMNIRLESSDGSIFNEGTGYFEHEEDIQFANVNEANTQYPIDSVISSNWLGNSLGSISVSDTIIRTSETGVAILRLKYGVIYRSYAVSVGPRDYDEYPVLVYIEEVL
ncbi:hypothetical protein J7J62_03830 [bacterium]|nr:hypothetical protein [bacterium]